MVSLTVSAPPVPPADPPPAAAPPAAPVLPSARVSVRASAGRSKLRVDVNPNVGRKHWTFTVQYLRRDGTWGTRSRAYRTQGAKETRTLDLGKGTYRILVGAAHGRAASMSGSVRLTR